MSVIPTPTQSKMHLFTLKLNMEKLMSPRTPPIGLQLTY